MGLSAQANAIARIGALSGLFGVDLSAMHGALGVLGPELAKAMIVTVPVTFDRLAVTTRVDRGQLDGICGDEQLRRIDRFTAGTRPLELELEAGGPHLARTVRVTGGRELVADLARLGTFGVAAGPRQLAQDCAYELGACWAIADRAGPDPASWRLEFRHANETDAARANTRDRLVAVATRLAATAAQTKLVGGIHEMMAKDRDSDSALLVASGDAVPRLAVRWRNVRWETAIRLALGFAPGVDVGTKLGELSGAFDSETLDSVELVLGPDEPPLMRVAAALVG